MTIRQIAPSARARTLRSRGSGRGPTTIPWAHDVHAITGLWPISALVHIPAPFFDPDMVGLAPGGFDLIWGFVRGFGRRSLDREA